MKSILVLFVLSSLLHTLHAQYDHIHVEKDLQGEELLTKLRDSYRTNTVFDYSQARDTLYQVVYREDGMVEGIYSGHKVALPDGVTDPSSFIFMNGAAYGINAEHSYPQSMGASSGNPKSDMHHIFPSAVKVNADRGSFPFGEINDNQTTSWYYLNSTLSNTPTNNIDLYSEGINGRFEPRESVKGNIARAIFYFYTMYKNEADNEDPNFFYSQLDDLCEWHHNDPVDSLEWIRTYRIAQYQDNQPNPYILDCSLAGRTFCDSVRYACEQWIITDTKETIIDQTFAIFPNPNDGKNIFIHIPQSLASKVNSVQIVNLLGEISYQTELSPYTTDLHVQTPNKLSSGIYIVVLRSDSQHYYQRLIIQ